MIFNSIRWRLQTWHGLILITVLTGFGFTAYHVARDNQFRRIDEDLEQHLGTLLRPTPPTRHPDWQPDAGTNQRPSNIRDAEGPPERERPGDPHPKEPHGVAHNDPADFLRWMQETIQRAGLYNADQTNAFYYALWTGDGTLVARSANAPEDISMPEHARPSRQGPPGRPNTRMREGTRELYRCFPHGECLLAGHFMAADSAAMQRLAFWLVAAGMGVLAIGLAGGFWLATRAIRPIDEISTTALKISAGDLSQRINASDTENEFGRLAAVLNSTFARLEAAFAHQVRFTSDASHELRTPISVILSQTQTALSRERTAGEYRETLEACQRAAQRMRKLAESLLELARLDAGQPMKREPFDLARVARDSVELLRPLAAERGIEIRLDLNSAECPGDAERIGQVATNLLSNALYFNREKGEVRLAVHAENGTAFLTVADTGEGIPKEDLPHIFERFYRVDKARSRVQGRTGLGLAICKAIADAHGGGIDVESRPGEGSTFTLKLPLN
jgi:signal transduction histidine kinase